ncbi:alpha/beta-hydrolase [Marasmius fiardii PR-910]|nr:alpha/beta-hydrolase [Marasmius fiardii PR-910]
MPPHLLSVIAIQLLGLTLAACTPTATDTKNNVNVHGIQHNGVEQFLNIPYGQDTGGEKRFTNPERFVFPPNTTEYNATLLGPICPQLLESEFTQSEDCLKLRIARPAGVKKGDKLPVMVYIYGGGLFIGHINRASTDPEGLILQSIQNGLPVIYVAMNYRLNIFGFALSESLRTRKSLNLGLKDQRLALEWVQQNIGYFGGDPERVTIFGQSSGGLSVTLQILAYGGTRPIPFHGGIMESTALEPGSTSNLTFDTFNTVTKLTGCDIDGDPQSDASLECLRGLPMEQLLNITVAQHDSTADQNDGDTYLPVVDDDFLPLASSELAQRGMFPRIPIMIGWTQDDLTLFTHTNINTSSDTRDFIHLFFPDLTNTTLNTLLSLYPSSDFSPSTNFSAEFYRSATMFRDMLLVCPSFLFGHAMAQKYQNDNQSPAVYYFDQNQTVYGEAFKGLGVVHSSELAYVFSNFKDLQANDTGTINPTAADCDLQRRESRSWSSFANRGRPSLDGHETIEGWESAYGSDRRGMLDARLYVIGGLSGGISPLDGEGAKPEVARQKLRERCEFLNGEDVISQLKY